MIGGNSLSKYVTQFDPLAKFIINMRLCSRITSRTRPPRSLRRADRYLTRQLHDSQIGEITSNTSIGVTIIHHFTVPSGLRRCSSVSAMENFLRSTSPFSRVNRNHLRDISIPHDNSIHAKNACNSCSKDSQLLSHRKVEYALRNYNQNLEIFRKIWQNFF